MIEQVKEAREIVLKMLDELNAQYKSGAKQIVGRDTDNLPIYSAMSAADYRTKLDSIAAMLETVNKIQEKSNG